MNEKYGTIVIRTFDADSLHKSTLVRTSLNPSRDDTVCYKALEFDDAARRSVGARMCINTLQPRWKYWLLRAIGIPARDFAWVCK